MKGAIAIFLFIFIASTFCFSQNRHTTFLDSKGDTTSFELHHSFQVSGQYKSVYDRKTNTKRLIPYPPADFEKELARTKRKTVLKEKVGEDFPDFEVVDIQGRKFSKSMLKGKVVVVNYWFIGCAPCEMERPALNTIYQTYKENANVVFISFARDKKDKLERFLVKKPFFYPVVPLDEELIQKLDIKGYPQNQIIGKDGRYVFNSIAAGIGSEVIIRSAIEEALGH